MSGHLMVGCETPDIVDCGLGTAIHCIQRFLWTIWMYGSVGHVGATSILNILCDNQPEAIVELAD